MLDVDIKVDAESMAVLAVRNEGPPDERAAADPDGPRRYYYRLRSVATGDILTGSVVHERRYGAFVLLRAILDDLPGMPERPAPFVDRVARPHHPGPVSPRRARVDF